MFVDKEKASFSKGVNYGGLNFGIANSEQERIRIFNSRLDLCEAQFPYLLNYENVYPAMDEFDDCSILFYLASGEQVIGSCRVTPFSNNSWEISKHLPDDFYFHFDASRYVQVNRVYVHKDFRNMGLHAFMFYHLSVWVMAHTGFSRFFAICNSRHVKLYCKLGAELVSAQEIYLKHRRIEPYYLIEGDIEKAKLTIENKYLYGTNAD